MVYLDYAATTPLLPEVMKAMNEAEQRFFANASALHTPGHLALTEVERARATIAEAINCSPEEIIFTSGASESNNTVVRTFVGCKMKVSPLEHHSVIVPAEQFQGRKWPRLRSVMLANNETGEFLALPEIDRTEWTPAPTSDSDASTEGVSAKARKSSGESEASFRAAQNWQTSLFEVFDDWGHPLVTDRRKEYLHSDLTQVLGKIPVDVQKLGLDYATLAAHKIGGPLGVGALYVRKGVPFKPLILGGNQENKRRGGTYNTVGIIGFGTAVRRVLETRPWEAFDTRVRKLRDTLAKRILAEIPGSSLNTPIRGIGGDFGRHDEAIRGGDAKNDAKIVDASTIFGADSLPNILNVSFRAAEGESIQLYLDAEGIIVSTGSACAAGDTKPSHVLMAKTGDAEVAHSSIRFSFGLENTPEDVERVMEVLPGVVKRLQGMSTIG